MNDDELRRALRSLSVPRARQGFTARVLARVQAARPEPRWTPARTAAAAAALMVALAAGVWLARPPVEPRPTLAELRAEQHSIETELRSLEHIAARSGPVLLLDASQETDVILDLGELLRRRAEPAPTTSASHSREEL